MNCLHLTFVATSWILCQRSAEAFSKHGLDLRPLRLVTRSCRSTRDLERDHRYTLMSFDSNPNVQEVRVEKNPSRETTLRESLSGYAKDSELQETLIRCGLAMNNLDAPSSPASALNSVSNSEEPWLWTSDPCVRPSEEEMAGPIEGLNHFARGGKDGVFTSSAKVPIRYRLFPKYSPASKGGRLRPGVVVLPGLMETMCKYGETIADLNNRGFSVYTYDHHGQGLSGRLPLPKNADETVAHIKDFQHYVKDVIYFTKVVIPGAIAPCRDSRTVQLGQAIPPESAEILREHGVADSGASDQSRLPDTTTWPGLSVMGHSMGGLMAFYAALEDPTLFRGAVLVAPMFKVDTGRPPDALVGALAWLATRLGQGHRSPIRRLASPSMKGRLVTHDMARLRLWECLRAGISGMAQRGPSFTWLAQAVRASRRARRRFHALSIPVLVLEAGADKMVRSEGIARFLRRAPKASHRLFPAAYHDLLDETDDIRDEVIHVTIDFLRRVL